MQRNANIEQTSEINKDFFVISQRVKQIFAVYCKYAKKSKNSAFLQILWASLQKYSPQPVPPNELLSFGETLQYIMYQVFTRLQIGIKKYFASENK